MEQEKDENRGVLANIMKDIAANVLSWVIIGLISILSYLVVDWRNQMTLIVYNQEHALKLIEANTNRLDMRSEFIKDTDRRLQSLEIRFDYLMLQKQTDINP